MGQSFKNPLVPLIAQPVNIDRPIQEMQQSLANGLPWLDKCFGRSWESQRKDTAGKTWIYPEVWQGPGMDLLNCMPNDNLKAQAFFRVEDPIQVTEFGANQFNRMIANISIIFWFDLRVLDPDLNYRYIELLLGNAQRIITENPSPDGTFLIQRIWQGAQNVFKGYTIDIVNNQELIHPYGGFRFECSLNYEENCPDVVFFSDGGNIYDETFQHPQYV